MLRAQPVLTIEAVCVPAIHVDLVGPVSDVFGRYDHEPRGMCVINHSNNLQHRVVSPQGVPRARGVLYEDTLATAYRPCRGRDVLNRTLTTSFLAPSNVRAEANSGGEGNPVCSPHGITTDQRGVLPSLPWYDTAEHATEPLGLFPHL